MIKSKKVASNYSSVFGMMKMLGEFNKAMSENPDADRKETLRLIKKNAIINRKHQDNPRLQTVGPEDFITQNDLTMKRIIQQTKELIKMIDEECNSRQKFYASHGDRWQDSDIGRAYIEQTELLSQMLNQLNDSICELSETV